MSNLPGKGSNDIEPNVSEQLATQSATAQRRRHEHGERDGGGTNEVEKEVGHSMCFKMTVLTSEVVRGQWQQSRWRTRQLYDSQGRTPQNDDRNQSPGETRRG
jgi:hypothetical protein